MNCDIFIFAGETSGDYHGSHLLKEMYQINPHLNICGVGGPKMRSLAFECLKPMEEFQVMGFTDVFLSLPKLVKSFYQVRKWILEKQPKMVVFIDYPGFNLRMAKSLRKQGFTNKLVHYISPTVWAWGKKRTLHMAKTLDLLLTILPFEAEYFAKTSLPTRYVGHPLMEEIRQHVYDPDWKRQFGLQKPFFALFPGSRKGEIVRNLPLQYQAAKQLNMPFAISCAHQDLRELIVSIVGNDIPLIPNQYSYDMMKDAEFAISKSGTATLELALHGCPTVVTYQLTRLNYFLAKYVFRINLPHYCLANILLQESLFPEMVGLHLNASELVEHAKALKKASAHEGVLRLKALLTEENASLNAAKAILALI